MAETIWKMASETGIWAALFCALFFIQIKDSKTRETKYQQTIDTLAEKLKMISEIKEDIEEIKKNVVKSDNANL